jgi:hypothetical protein
LNSSSGETVEHVVSEARTHVTLAHFRSVPIGTFRPVLEGAGALIFDHGCQLDHLLGVKKIRAVLKQRHHRGFTAGTGKARAPVAAGTSRTLGFAFLIESL